MNEQTSLSFANGPRISRATIARLHNRGNYEHSRYEVTVEIPPGVDAGSVLRELDQMLEDIEPCSPVSMWDLRRAIDALKSPPIENDPHDQGNRRTYSEYIRRHSDWEKRRDAAYARFTELNGIERYTDAKVHWDRDDEQY